MCCLAAFDQCGPVCPFGRTLPQTMVDVLHFAGQMGSMGAVADLVAVVKALDPAEALKPLAGTSLKGLTTPSAVVTADRAYPSDVTPLNALELAFFLLSRLCSGTLAAVCCVCS